MAYEIEFDPDALKDLKKLDQNYNLALQAGNAQLAAQFKEQDEAIAAEAYIHLYPPRGFASPGARQVSRGGSLVVPSPGDPQERPCDSDGDCCRRIVVN